MGTKANTWKELEKDVVGNGGLLTVSGEDLRRIYGAERLGSNIRASIRRNLTKVGLAFDDAPEEFYQEDILRIYKRGTAAAQIIHAVNHLGERHDEVIREWVNGDQGKLARIREVLAS